MQLGTHWRRGPLWDGPPLKQGESAGCFDHVLTLITANLSLLAKSGATETPDPENVFHITSLPLHFCLIRPTNFFYVFRYLGSPFLQHL